MIKVSVHMQENYQTLFDAALTFLDSFDTYANFQRDQDVMYSYS